MTPQAQKPIGYDPATGRAVLGFDPNSGLPVFAEQAAPPPTTQPQPAPFNPPRMMSTREDSVRFTPQQVQAASKHLPMAGAIIGTALTGGAGAPSIAAAAGGAGAGQFIKDLQYRGASFAQRAENAVKSAAGAAITQGIGVGLSALAPAAAAKAKDLWKGAAKIPAPVAKQTQTALRGGSIPAAEDEIAETVLEQGAGTIGRKNLERMRTAIDDLDDQISEIIQNSKAFVKRSDIEQALVAKSHEIGFGTLAKVKEQKAISAALDEIKNLPARMTVQKAQDVKQSIYQARKYVADSNDAAEAMADKTMGRAYRSEIAREEPAVRPLNEQMTKQIPATKAMEAAVTRTGHASAAPLSQLLAGIVTNPLTVAHALMNRPGVASFTAQQIYNVAKKLAVADRTVPNILRALQALGKRDE